ncbi:predicted protein [Uncinocarpus reesii 1704]|uniref:Uncharacterized protein n=1 Tax=Uncinocarpus reesii (strain UAMH 1704) TaxID=336963 RepID=C4JNA2_UNCRE|nr:uncharacterized protein UREG_04308 [Uncinocarpus reesii 1704]EEP79462.1 predicted protein [Uncinocarpus reesii 1704]
MKRMLNFRRRRRSTTLLLATGPSLLLANDHILIPSLRSISGTRAPCSCRMSTVAAQLGTRASSVNNTLSSSFDSRQLQRHFPLAPLTCQNCGAPADDVPASQANRLTTLTEEPTAFREERNDSGVMMTASSQVQPGKKEPYDRPNTSAATKKDRNMNWGNYSLSKSKSTSNLASRSKQSSDTETLTSDPVGSEPHPEQLGNFRESLEQQFAMDTSIQFDINRDMSSSLPHLGYHSDSPFNGPSHAAPARAQQSRLSMLAFEDDTKQANNPHSSDKRHQSFAKRFSAHFSWKRYPKG